MRVESYIITLRTFKELQSRRAMEASLQSQVDAVFAATEELVSHHCIVSLSEPLILFQRGYFEHTSARSEQLQKFDELAKNALEQRKLRHDEWRTWKSDLIASTSLLRLKPKSRHSPRPNDAFMVAAYDLAGQSESHCLVSTIILIRTKDMEVRKCISRAEVVRFTFRDKAIEEVDVPSFTSIAYNVLIHIKAISLVYQVVIDAFAKCLQRFAENQQYLFSSDPFAYC